MTSIQRWQEIDGIFAAALELEPADRPKFLDEACAGDEQLRKEVESLIAHDMAESSFGGHFVDEGTRLLVKPQTQELDGEHIGPYQIVGSLGAGGMGRVYLAQDTRLNRRVAVKLLSFYDAAEHERIRRFRQEALAVSALNHPNILTIYEIGEFEGHNYIATEFVDGETLLTRIQGGHFSVETAFEIVTQVASALSAAHAAGIVHRDIKPANIMVRSDGLVKVLDFGIAKYTQQDGVDEQNETLLLTTPGAVIGTAAYMSPEQARGNPIDARSDLWSLGVVFYEMVTGRRPFQGETTLDLMSAVIERDPPSLSDSGLVAPDFVERIIFKALKKDREARYQTATDMLADLKRSNNRASPTLTSPEETQRKESDTREQRSPTEDPTVSRRYLLAGAVLVLLLLVVGLVYRLYGDRRPLIESIAVLPFKNESGNGDVEYLSDGMTESLINGLSQLPNLSVKARSSVFRYKGKDIDPQTVASELSVQAVLSGRVVQRGNDLTVYLSLVGARDGNQLWGEQYDRKVADLVSLQREIARDVSQKLRARLSGAEERKVTKDYTANAEANQLYLKGRFHVFKLTPPEIRTGISYLQQAIQLDPNYALAYVGLSEANRSLAVGGEMTPTEFLPKAKEAAQKAVDLDDGLAEAHAALAVTMFWYDWKWDEAENQFKRALELNSNSSDTHLFYAHLLSNTGRHAEALAEIKRARTLDPYSPFLNALEGQFLLHAGKPDEALVKLRETFDLAPGFWFPHLFASSAYVEKGMLAEAVAEARRATELSSAQTISTAYEGYALAKWGKRDEARNLLERLLNLSRERFVPPYHLAVIYIGLGERDQALTWLERGFEQRDPKMAFLKVEPKWSNLRGDPRFEDLMRRLGFSR